jgi:hypothetical protein
MAYHLATHVLPESRLARFGASSLGSDFHLGYPSRVRLHLNLRPLATRTVQCSSPVFNESLSEADGARTRNLWIDSPVL